VDILEGNAAIKDVQITHSKLAKLSLISAPATMTMSEIPTLRFPALIRQLTEMADYVLVDTCSGLDVGFKMAVDSCERFLLVTTGDDAAVRVASRAAYRIGKEKRGAMIINRVNPHMVKTRNARTLDEIMNITGLPLLGMIPEDEMVPAASHAEIPLVFSGGDGAAAAVLRITRRLLGESVPLKRMKQWKVD
jgi:septum site-determining protein MinD